MPIQSKRPKGVPLHIPAWAWKWLKWRTAKKPKPAPKPTPTPTPTPTPKPVKMLMFDDTNVGLIPKTAQAIAGYSDGHFQTWKQILELYPHAKHVQIAVFGQDNGDCLDVEPGDAQIAQAAAWLRRQLAGWKTKHHDVRLPVIYTSASWAQNLVDTLAKAGLKQGTHYLLWTAHYDPKRGEHLCSPSCGFGLKTTANATQFTDHALNRSLDESICSPGFFGT